MPTFNKNYTIKRITSSTKSDRYHYATFLHEHYFGPKCEPLSGLLAFNKSANSSYFHTSQMAVNKYTPENETENYKFALALYENESNDLAAYLMGEIQPFSFYQKIFKQEMRADNGRFRQLNKNQSEAVVPGQGAPAKFANLKGNRNRRLPEANNLPGALSNEVVDRSDTPRNNSDSGTKMSIDNYQPSSTLKLLDYSLVALLFLWLTDLISALINLLTIGTFKSTTNLALTLIKNCNQKTFFCSRKYLNSKSRKDLIMYIKMHATDSDMRGKGLGSMIIKELIAVAKEKRIDHVVVVASGLGTKKIYDKLGFQKVGFKGFTNLFSFFAFINSPKIPLF